ncbi:hypothetical protein Ga0100231_017845 [Opitutaceae bacterium TAV4]|nr:hypothetical protein Ga0100231_017845 [Opitutaceae bacterium TAV4]
MSFVLHSVSQGPTPNDEPESASPLAGGRDWHKRVMREIEPARWWAGTVMKPLKPEVLEFVVKTAKENPYCPQEVLVALARAKFGADQAPSRASVRKLLVQCGRVRVREDGFLAVLEEKCLTEGVGEWLPPFWWRKLLMRNPVLSERKRETSVAGERVCQGWYQVGRYEGFQYHVHVTIDTFGSFATGEVFCGTNTDLAVELLERHTLPVYAEAGVSIRELETRGSVTYTSNKDGRSFGGFLKLHGIEHRARLSYEPSNGFLLKFRQVLLPGFLLPWRQRLESSAKRPGRPASADLAVSRAREKLLEMRMSFASWLEDYNRTPIEGYRNMGKSPRDFWKQAG